MGRGGIVRLSLQTVGLALPQGLQHVANLLFHSIFFFCRVTIKIIKIFNKDKGVRRVYYSLSAKHSFLHPDVCGVL